MTYHGAGGLTVAIALHQEVDHITMKAASHRSRNNKQQNHPHEDDSLMMAGLRFSGASTPALNSIRQLHTTRAVMMAAPAHISFGAMETISAAAPQAKKTGVCV